MSGLGRRLTRLERAHPPAPEITPERAMEAAEFLMDAQAYAGGAESIYFNPEIFTFFTSEMLTIFAADPVMVRELHEWRAAAEVRGRLVRE